MSSAIITNISQLVNVREKNRLLRGKSLADLPVIANAWVSIEEEHITAYGSMDHLPVNSNGYTVIDAKGATVLPCWCDSHTHLVFAKTREGEFVDKLRGLSYAEIAARGGGILNSARSLNETSEDQLFQLAWQRLEELTRLGTGAVEIKSGYGLNVEAELKILRVIKKLKGHSSVSIKSTFLGAHAYPPEYKDDHQAYLDLLVNEMLPVIGKEKLADYIDVFCEQGFFSTEETEFICRAGARYGLKPKLHVNQLHSIGGIETGIRMDAISLDHLEVLTDKDLQLLAGKFIGRETSKQGSIEPGENNEPWTGVCTLLPTAAFFLRMPLQPARTLIDSGCAVAIASDYNPGSSPSGNMNFVLSISCIQMSMLPEEAINAATLNGAYAMELQDEVGSISIGKYANLILTRPVPSIAAIPYFFGTNLIDRVMIRGNWV